MRRYLALSDRATSPNATGVADVTHLIWPESAFPVPAGARPAGAGADRRSPARRRDPRSPAPRASPSGSPAKRATIISIRSRSSARAALLLDRYDKQHLVPFGEYLPFRRSSSVRRDAIRPFSRRLRRWRRHERAACPGAARRAAAHLLRGDLSQEIGLLATGDARRAGWLLNVTDDAWFGVTPGPYQHFAQARLRAIEQGLPLVRAANTGISAVVDAWAASSPRAARRRRRARQRVAGGSPADLAVALGIGHFRGGTPVDVRSPACGPVGIAN